MSTNISRPIAAKLTPRRAKPAPSLVLSQGQAELRFLRDRGRSGKELAALAGCSQIAMSRYLRGHATPEFEVRERLRDAIGLPLHLWTRAPARTEIQRLALFGLAPEDGKSAAHHLRLALGYYPMCELLTNFGRDREPWTPPPLLEAEARPKRTPAQILDGWHRRFEPRP